MQLENCLKVRAKRERGETAKGVFNKDMERKKVEKFEDLLVWQKGMEIVRQIYQVTRDGKLSRDFSLRDQLRRAALSIPANIAEGFDRSRGGFPEAGGRCHP